MWHDADDRHARERKRLIVHPTTAAWSVAPLTLPAAPVTPR